jgi:hypothetical protein
VQDNFIHPNEQFLVSPLKSFKLLLVFIETDLSSTWVHNGVINGGKYVVWGGFRSCQRFNTQVVGVKCAHLIHSSAIIDAADPTFFQTHRQTPAAVTAFATAPCLPPPRARAREHSRPLQLLLPISRLHFAAEDFACCCCCCCCGSIASVLWSALKVVKLSCLESKIGCFLSSSFPTLVACFCRLREVARVLHSPCFLYSRVSCLFLVCVCVCVCVCVFVCVFFALLHLLLQSRFFLVFLFLWVDISIIVILVANIAASL